LRDHSPRARKESRGRLIARGLTSMLRGRSYRWTGPVRTGGRRVLSTSHSKNFGELKIIVRTPNEFRRDAIFLPVSFEEFWNSEIHQDHIKPRRVH